VKIPHGERLIPEKPADDEATTWIEPVLYCEVEYSQITRSGTFRDPVFVRMRPDLATQDV
jgi:ATP-dependent DNA ligase